MIDKTNLTMSKANSRRLFDFRSSLFWLVPLLFAFVVSAWFQLRVFENKTVFLFDSAGYLVNAGDCAQIIIDIFSGRLDQAWRLASSKEFVERMIVDGPTIPLFGALAFMLSGKAAVATNWATMVLWLSLLNGICAAGVSLLAKRQTDSSMFALCAGILFGLYPGTIIAAGRFFTEPLTAALLMVLVLLGCYLVNCGGLFRSLVSALVIGVIAGLGVLLKTALLPAWGLLTLAPIILMRGSSRSKIIGAFLVMMTGGCLMVGCWAVYTKAASGTVYLIPQRVPLLNIAVGHDLETDGWASVIGKFMGGHLATSKTSADVLVKSWRLSPLKITDLYLRKVSRTMGFVWNDFKQPLLFLDVDGQNWLHAFLIAFASAGTLFSIRFLGKAFTSKPLDGASIYTSLACLVIVFTHAVIYLPFEANSRYGYPCVPFLFCLAAFAIRKILGSRRRGLLLLLVLVSVLIVKLDLVAICSVYCSFATALVLTEILRLAILLAAIAALLTSVKSDLSQACLDSSWFSPPVLFACALLSIFFVLLPVALTTAFIVDRRTVEIALSPGQSVVRKVLLPGQSQTPELAQYFLLVDCNDKFIQGHCRVNGAALPGHLISANKLDSSVYGSFNVLRMFAQAMDLSSDQLRQWRIVPIPQGLLRVGQTNVLEISSGQSGFSLLGDRLLSGETTVRLPCRKSMSLSKAYNLDARSAIESRIVDQIATPVAGSSAVVAAADGSTVRKLIDIQPRLFVLKVEPKARPQGTSSSVGSLVEKTVAIAAEQFDPVMYQGNSPALIRNNRYTLAQAVSTGVVVDFPPEIAANGILELSISGEILSTGRENKAGILLAINSSQANSPPMFLSSTPPYITAKKDWSKFEIVDQLNLDAYKCRLDKLSLVLFPGRAEQIMQYGVDRTVGSFYLRNLQVTFKQLSLPDLADCTETIF
mgnify:CR=1 FL=1